MSPDALVPLLLRATLYTAAALSICLLLRRPLRGWLGATAAYTIWACVPLALLAAVLPSPQSDVALLKVPLLAAMPALSNAHDGAAAWTTLALAVWLTGSALMAAMLWQRQHRFVRSLGPLHALDNAVWSATHDAGLPASLGIWRPRIVVPSDFTTRYCAAERALVLARVPAGSGTGLRCGRAGTASRQAPQLCHGNAQDPAGCRLHTARLSLGCLASVDAADRGVAWSSERCPAFALERWGRAVARGNTQCRRLGPAASTYRSSVLRRACRQRCGGCHSHAGVELCGFHHDATA